MVGITSLDHVQLAMPANQEARARQFYVDILGFEEQEKPASLTGRGGCWFMVGPVNVHLGVEADFNPAMKAHPAFIVDDIEAAKDQIARAGYEIVEDDNFPGFKRFYTSDPFGNRIEILQPTS